MRGSARRDSRSATAACRPARSRCCALPRRCVAQLPLVDARAAAPDTVADDVWLGRVPRRARRSARRVRGDRRPDGGACRSIRRAGTTSIFRCSTSCRPTRRTLSAAAEAIERARARGRVLVCCALGFSRSAAAVAAWLVATGRAANLEAAIAQISARGPRSCSGRCAPRAARRARVGIGVASRLIDAPVHNPLRRQRDLRLRAPRHRRARVVEGGPPKAVQRIYYGNHSSHGDFALIWASLPEDLRERTRPVAGADYWNRTRLRRLLHPRGAARRPDRARARRGRAGSDRADGSEPSSHDDSLILFPEGTRNTTDAHAAAVSAAVSGGWQPRDPMWSAFRYGSRT